MQIDTSTPFGQRVGRRLNEELIAWLTTVRPDGTPEPSPVWFLWDGAACLIYSRPNTPKLRNIDRSPRVSLNLDGDRRGGDIVVMTGQARIDPDAPSADRVGAYVAKYAERIKGIGLTPDRFAQAYSVAIRFTPERLRGH
jgi:PPOX class probable F420-dependent enzyme